MGDARPDVRELYERHGRAVYRRCQYFLRNDEEARDAMHEVFVKVVERYHEFRGAASPLTWMVCIATHHCLNILRARKAAWHERYQRAARIDAETKTSETESWERAEVVRAILERLEPEVQEAAVHYYADEMKQDEAAAACGCSVPTLRKRLRRFLEVARREMKRIDVDVVFSDCKESSGTENGRNEERASESDASEEAGKKNRSNGRDCNSNSTNSNDDDDDKDKDNDRDNDKEACR